MRRTTLIKSNNPHLVGGEKHFKRRPVFNCIHSCIFQWMLAKPNTFHSNHLPHALVPLSVKKKLQMQLIWAQYSGLVIAFYTGGSSKWMAVSSGCQDSAKQMLDSEALQQQVMGSENFSGPKHKLSVQDATGTCQKCALKFPWLKPQKTDRQTVLQSVASNSGHWPHCGRSYALRPSWKEVQGYLPQAVLPRALDKDKVRLRGHRSDRWCV